MIKNNKEAKIKMKICRKCRNIISEKEYKFNEGLCDNCYEKSSIEDFPNHPLNIKDNPKAKEQFEIVKQLGQMEDTRTDRKEREESIIKCLKELAKIHNVGKYQYQIETWTFDDSEPIVIGKAGIQITMFW